MAKNPRSEPVIKNLVDVSEREAVPEKVRAGLPDRSRFSVQIYHLSDLHFPHEPIADRKLSFGQDYDPNIGALPGEIFREFIQNAEPIAAKDWRFLIVSGDLASKATFEELREGVKFIEKTQADLRPPVKDDQVVIVPGNHDVNWKIATSSSQSSQKFDTFRSRINDTGRKYLLPTFSERAGDPCRFYPNQGVLIYALNSCLLGGVVKEEIKDAQAALKTMSELLDSHARNDAVLREEIQQAITKLKKIGDAPSVIDAGLVGKDFIGRIADDLRRKRKSLSNTRKQIFDNSFRIAVLHHHVSSFTPAETKEFEELIDAGALKAALLRQGFHMVLHGHKHQPRITRESIIDKRGERSLVIVAAGSLGDWQSGSSFNVITLSDPLADRVNVQIDVIKMTTDKSGFEPDPIPPFVIRKKGEPAVQVGTATGR